MSLLYTWANSIRLLREKAKRNPLDSYHYDIHPRIHNIDDVSEKIYEELEAIDDTVQSILEKPENTTSFILGGSSEKTSTEYELYKTISLEFILEKLSLINTGLGYEESLWCSFILGITPNDSVDVDNNILIQLVLANETDEIKRIVYKQPVPKYAGNDVSTTVTYIQHIFTHTELMIGLPSVATKILIYTKQLDDTSDKGYSISGGHSYGIIGKTELKSGLVS
jgi:hypothetical protein